MNRRELRIEDTRGEKQEETEKLLLTAYLVVCLLTHFRCWREAIASNDSDPFVLDPSGGSHAKKASYNQKDGSY